MDESERENGNRAYEDHEISYQEFHDYYDLGTNHFSHIGKYCAVLCDTMSVTHWLHRYLSLIYLVTVATHLLSEMMFMRIWCAHVLNYYVMSCHVI